MRRLATAAPAALITLTLALSTGGCTLFQKGETRAQYRKADTNLIMTTASRDGDYALYVNNDTSPRVVQALSHGDRLGFERNDEGRVRAVAGSFAATLEPDTKTANWSLLSNKR